MVSVPWRERKHEAHRLMGVGFFFYTRVRVLDATKPPAVSVLNEAVSVADSWLRVWRAV